MKENRKEMLNSIGFFAVKCNIFVYYFIEYFLKINLFVSEG